MYDTICTLPLPSDLLASAIHPTLPIFAVGLASGHVLTYRLPSTRAIPPTSKAAVSIPPFQNPAAKTPNGVFPQDKNRKTERNGTPNQARPRASSLVSLNGHAKDANPACNGFGTVETLWRTRRHRGSCRALAFSTDGATLFSAGTDGIIKAACSFTGRVGGKVLIPRVGYARASRAAKPPSGDFKIRGLTSRISKIRVPDSPTTLLALSPQVLVLGTDSGGIHIFPLRAYRLQSPKARQKPAKPSTTTEILVPSHKLTQSHNPHPDRDPITSLTPLPPTATSTSKLPRAFTSTAGNTLCVLDVYKGVVSTSVSQGEELGCAACLTPPPAAAETVLAGQSTGAIALFPRGHLHDRVGSVACHSLSQSGGASTGLGLWGDDAGVECLAVSPSSHLPSPNENGADDRVIAAGLGNGTVTLLSASPTFTSTSASTRSRAQGAGVSLKVVGSVTHDERGIESVLFVGFDSEGRLMSGGGDFVKVWFAKGPSEEGEVESGPAAAAGMTEQGSTSEEDDAAKVNGVAPRPHRKRRLERDPDSGDSDEGEEEEEVSRAKRHKKRRRGGKGRSADDAAGNHSVFRVDGLD